MMSNDSKFMILMVFLCGLACLKLVDEGSHIQAAALFVSIQVYIVGGLLMMKIDRLTP